MPEIQPDMSNANRCISVHWSLPVQCERSNRHFEYWHWARHPETGNRIRYRRSFGVHATEELRDGEWHALTIPPPVRHDIPTLLAEVERLTAEGVAASERRDYYQARCEQMERDHAETVAEVENRVHRAFSDADEQGLVLDALTVNELTQLVMTAIRAGGEQT
jgi:hypothetical protein